MLHSRFIDFRLPGPGLPVPGSVIGGIDLWMLVRMLSQGTRRHAAALAPKGIEH